MVVEPSLHGSELSRARIRDVEVPTFGGAAASQTNKRGRVLRWTQSAFDAIRRSHDLRVAVLRMIHVRSYRARSECAERRLSPRREFGESPRTCQPVNGDNNSRFTTRRSDGPARGRLCSRSSPVRTDAGSVRTRATRVRPPSRPCAKPGTVLGSPRSYA